ncbi:unnamed protein product [Caenorhabditis sp. 36 PRJEB53466]|nr:unnamed protein product [Caenorhabditis sp. 36 PRJEB53466]
MRTLGLVVAVLCILGSISAHTMPLKFGDLMRAIENGEIVLGSQRNRLSKLANQLEARDLDHAVFGDFSEFVEPVADDLADVWNDVMDVVANVGEKLREAADSGRDLPKVAADRLGLKHTSTLDIHGLKDVRSQQDVWNVVYKVGKQLQRGL